MATLARTLSDYSCREQGDRSLQVHACASKRFHRDSFRWSRADEKTKPFNALLDLPPETPLHSISFASSLPKGSVFIRLAAVIIRRVILPECRQDAQKGRSARPQRAKRRGATYRTSCGPFALRMNLGERKSPSSNSDVREALFGALSL
jgi:hypothetical protein